jgi:polysaccharide deacetylase family protein (PEP-CTERM system associated)
MQGNFAVSKFPVKNLLTIDIEDWFHILNVSSLPSLQDWGDLESRVVFNTLTILDLLDKYITKGTFFVLGWVAEHFPDLVREIKNRGHELGSHGYSHEPIDKLTPEQFRRDVSLSLEHLSRITSKPILGYRAPGFSISPTTLYALDILLDLGFAYDASIFSLKRDRGGFPNFSQQENWINTPKGDRILEISVTPVNWFGQKIYPFGGGYFRLAPYSIVKLGIQQLNAQGTAALIYLHPREIDANHPRLKMNLVRNFQTYINLKQTRSKFERLLQEFEFDSIKNIYQLSPDTELLAA